MPYEVYTTISFDREMVKLNKEEQDRIRKIFLQLRGNPYVGDHLQIKILREKRLEEKRIYYLVFDDLTSVLVVAISNKKTQQKTIDQIIKYVGQYRAYLLDLLKRKN